MLKGSWARIALLTVAGAAFSQAAPVSLGFISFNNTGADGSYHIFNINNWTNGIGFYPVQTPVQFTDATLRITRMAGLEEMLSIPLSLGPQFSAHASHGIASSKAITRAVFHATLDQSQLWYVSGRGTFSPPVSTLELTLLPANGNSFEAGIDSWEIEVDMPDPSDASSVPEPMTGILAATGLLSVLAAGRLRK